jgi:hypothetical protein
MTMRTILLPAVAAAVTLLTACSAGAGMPGASLVPPTAATRSLHQATQPLFHKSGLLYVTSYTDQAGGQVVIYKLPLAKNAQPVSTISIPEGINSVDEYDALDDSGNLYVSSNSDAEVQIYPPGATYPSTIITSGINYPAGVAVDHKGKLYVANTFGYSSAYTGTVTEYPAGQTSPSRTISGFNDPQGIALDRSGNLWVVNEYAPPYLGYQIMEVKHGSATPVDKSFTGLSEPIDIAVDNAGNVYVTDDVANAVYIYGKGQTSPKAQIVPDSSKLQQTYGLCFNAGGDLFVSYIEDSQSTITALVEYRDPLHNPKAHRMLTAQNGLPGAIGCVASEP